ncbi:uncharacterized protein EV420DRAFT_1209100 [Desarmillaria tabescens]|uniref:Uncharacterized protein n=1 Tax=Armillaria tabescens TaxID=1929756 RepID=A0AA39JAU1_ARMTA|nr:uncharacterized protein EV420DRAFT_1209100 [Desarmillaria tabescens]KAK0438537.1 hypothetical protein EV420DRAFT_1209100 [Desarmillaria tabescens]
MFWSQVCGFGVLSIFPLRNVTSSRTSHPSHSEPPHIQHCPHHWRRGGSAKKPPPPSPNSSSANSRSLETHPTHTALPPSSAKSSPRTPTLASSSPTDRSVEESVTILMKTIINHFGQVNCYANVEDEGKYMLVQEPITCMEKKYRLITPITSIRCPFKCGSIVMSAVVIASPNKAAYMRMKYLTNGLTKAAAQDCNIRSHAILLGTSIPNPRRHHVRDHLPRVQASKIADLGVHRGASS